MNAVKCRKVVAAWLAAALLSLAELTACSGTLEVSVERTPTPNQAATATVAALATENARLATQVATMAPPVTLAVNCGTKLLEESKASSTAMDFSRRMAPGFFTRNMMTSGWPT